MTPPLDTKLAADVRAHVEGNFDPLSDKEKSEVDAAIVSGEPLPGTERLRTIAAENESQRLAITRN